MLTWTIAKYAVKKTLHISKILSMIFTLTVCVLVNLAQRNWFPVSVAQQDSLIFTGIDMLAFILVNVTHFHDFKIVMLFNGPVFLVSSYFVILSTDRGNQDD